MQGVVFNAHYLAYVDDAIECWCDAALGDERSGTFDMMLKRATIEWSSPVRYRDPLVLDLRVSRWGTTSFDVTADGTVGERPAFTATILYVSVRPGTHEPVPVPDDIRAALSSPSSPTS
jgi:acyl-CoA thioester hydrolase